LHPETPAEGLALSDLFRGREDQLAGFMSRTREIAKQENMENDL